MRTLPTVRLTPSHLPTTPTPLAGAAVVAAPAAPGTLPRPRPPASIEDLAAAPGRTGPARTTTEVRDDAGPTTAPPTGSTDGSAGPTAPPTEPRILRRQVPGERAPVGLVVEPDQASMMVAVAAVEVLSGARQQVQIARWLLPDVYEALGRRAVLVCADAAAAVGARVDGAPAAGARSARARPLGAAGSPSDPRVGVQRSTVSRMAEARAAVSRVAASRAAAPRSAAPHTGGAGGEVTVRRVPPPTGAAADPGRPEMVGGVVAAHGLRPVVRSLRMMRVDEDTVEAAVVVSHVGRVRAVALRLVRRQGRWRASALEIG